MHLLRDISYYRLSGDWYPLLANKLKPKQPVRCCSLTIFIHLTTNFANLITEQQKIEVVVRMQTAYIFLLQWDVYLVTGTSRFNNPVHHADIFKW